MGGNKYSDFVKSILVVPKEFNEAINKLGKFAYNIIRILVPLIDGTFVKQNKATIERWAEFGWTIIAHAPIDLFFQVPKNQLEADKMALQYCKRKDLEILFEDLYSYKTRKSFLDEAIDCFNNATYMACSMILISIIERKIIQFQKINGKCRDLNVGMTALKWMKTHLENNQKVNNATIVYLFLLNFEKFLENLFYYTDDFRNEPNNLNRNFLMHGMSSKRIRRKDCIKLFLAVRNFDYLLNYYDYQC